MKILIFFAAALLGAAPCFAAISTTTNFIDQNFNGADALYIVDLDRDGDLDILGAGRDANEIAWWENNGSEVFTKWSIDSAFNGAAAVYAVDIDGDGDIDVLAAGATANTVAWWENNGNPRQNNWANQYNIDAAVNGANSVFAIDIDFDGDIDVLAASGTGAGALDDISWWENNGNPRVNNWTEYTVDANFDGANSITALDVDLDGDLDILASANNDNDVSWWENPGNPRLSNWANKWDIDADFNGACSATAIDMDKDGDMDILAASSGGNSISWWENDGNSKKNNWTEYRIDTAFNGAASVCAIDLDFDGDPDILGAANTGNDVSWWENDGNPKKSGWGENLLIDNFNGASFVCAADLDADGDIDVFAAADTDDDIAWWANTANPVSGNIGFLDAYKIDDFFNGASSVSTVDIDNDGDIDIVGVARIQDDIIWWENNGSQNEILWTSHIVDSNFNGACDAVYADLDRDGDIDIISVADNADELAWWENDGSENFTKRSIDSNLNGANSVFIEDLDTDGDLDIAATAGIDDDLIWWESDATPSDGGWIRHAIDEDLNGANGVFCVDLDGDGDIDVLAAANVSDELAWWRNDGSENFAKLIIDDNFNGAASIEALDIDRDGDIDIVACAYNGSSVCWWANDGTPNDGGWTKYTVDGNFNGASSIVAADIDLDGDIDIAGAAKAGDEIAWWESDGTPSGGIWTKHSIGLEFNGAVSVLAIDLDRDGDIDIVAAAQDGDDIAWWANGGTRVVDVPTTTGGATPYLNVNFDVLNTPTHTISSSVSGPGESASAEPEKEVQEANVKCFIATAAFGTPLANEVKKLCRFRNKYLLTNKPGRLLVETYYRLSPPFAKAISENGFLKQIARIFIKLLLKVLPA